MYRILTFHFHGQSGNETRMLPAYYMEADYTPVAVRINAEDAPLADAQIDIFDDGVSIFNNRTPLDYHYSTQKAQTKAAVTAAFLSGGVNSDENAEDFRASIIEKGSWVHCNLVTGGGGKNFSVQFELFSAEEPLVEEE